VRDLELLCSVPAGLIEDDDGVGAGGSHGPLCDIATAARHVCLSGKTGSERRAAKATRLTQRRHQNSLQPQFTIAQLLRSCTICLDRRRQRDGGLGREQEEGQRLLKIEAHDIIRVTQIPDRDVLTDV